MGLPWLLCLKFKKWKLLLGDPGIHLWECPVLNMYKHNWENRHCSHIPVEKKNPRMLCTDARFNLHTVSSLRRWMLGQFSFLRYSYWSPKAHLLRPSNWVCFKTNHPFHYTHSGCAQHKHATTKRAPCTSRTHISTWQNLGQCRNSVYHSRSGSAGKT
jgi:hypothetical protein